MPSFYGASAYKTAIRFSQLWQMNDQQPHKE
jgi:hypothetical protein